LKSLKVIFLFVFAFSFYVKAQEVNLTEQFSLFYEYHKNKDYKSALPYGWTVVNNNPTDFIRFKVFRKMEEILWYMHDSVATTDDEKLAITDTTLYLYDKAIEYEADKKGYYLVRKAFVMEMWKGAPADEVISVYEEAFTADPDIISFYKDRLGILYSQNANDENGYKLKALELYSKLSEEEPDNATWIARIEALAEDMDELVDITKKAWDLDPQNPEKAWKYAQTAMRADRYDLVDVPLLFLIEKNPSVINYHRELAKAYDKTEQLDKAIDSYKKLIELQPDNRDNYVNIAIIYQKLDQLSVARSYLVKAQNVDPSWDYPIYIEAQLYEQSARNCIRGQFEFIDKCVYKLAVDTYAKARAKGGLFADRAGSRISQLSNSIPSKEDYFFQQLSNGDEIKIQGKCYDWIGKSITVQL